MSKRRPFSFYLSIFFSALSAALLGFVGVVTEPLSQAVLICLGSIFVAITSYLSNKQLENNIIDELEEQTTDPNSELDVDDFREGARWGYEIGKAGGELPGDRSNHKPKQKERERS